MSALSEEEEFEFRLRAERESAASPTDRAFADPRVRAAYGAAGLLTGPAQLGAEIGGFLNRKVVAPALDAVGATEAAARQRRYATAVPDAIDRGLSRAEASKQRGMAARSDDGEAGTDWAGISGAVLTGGFGAKQALQGGTRLVRAAKTLGTGAGFGVSAPITDDGEDSRLQNRVDAAATGTLLAAGVPVAAKAITGTVGGTGRLLQRAIDRFTPGGPKRIATRSIDQNIPEDVATELAKTLRTPKNFPPGYTPNAADLVAGTPEGTLIQSFEQIVANQPGNKAAGASPSVMFARRDAANAKALESAKGTRDALALQMRGKALALANDPAGPRVRAQPIKDAIFNIATTPGIRASTVAQKVMASVEKRIEDMTNARTGIVNADDLYTLRKELGYDIKKVMLAESAPDKKLAAGLQKDLQSAIDGAIEDALPASAKGEWRAYLADYSSRSKQINEAIDAAEDAYNPARRTNMSGVEEGAEKISFPATLSTAGLLVRSLEAMTRKATGPKVGVELAKILQDPDTLATILERSAQSGPLRKSAARYFSPAAGAAAGSAQIQE